MFISLVSFSVAYWLLKFFWIAIILNCYNLTAATRHLIYLKERSLLFTTAQGGFNSQPLIMNPLFPQVQWSTCIWASPLSPSEIRTSTLLQWFGPVRQARLPTSGGLVTTPRYSCPLVRLYFSSLLHQTGKSLTPNKNLLLLLVLWFSFFPPLKRIVVIWTSNLVSLFPPGSCCS